MSTLLARKLERTLPGTHLGEYTELTQVRKLVRCTNCKRWEAYPEEWSGMPEGPDRWALEDSYLCRNCFDIEEMLQCGLSELRGSTYDFEGPAR